VASGRRLRDGRAGTLLPQRPGEVAARRVAGFTTHLKLAPSVGRRHANHACSAYRIARIPIRTRAGAKHAKSTGGRSDKTNCGPIQER
jgi:hypothetical protein